MRWLWMALAAVVIAGGAAWWWPAAREMEGVQAETAVEAGEHGGGARQHAPASIDPGATSRFEPRRLPDGTLGLTERLSIAGSGSEQDPFLVTWPVLASAADTIDAATHRLAPPPHIAFLNGQWVQISAYLAPPLWGERTVELLVMKNRWDGCCIGLPPTPFDCIEASLAAPITLGAKHSISYGTVRGRLVVQPFTAGAFLLGLYRLEQAQIEDMKAR